jgi:hypothetical protein
MLYAIRTNLAPDLQSALSAKEIRLPEEARSVDLQLLERNVVETLKLKRFVYLVHLHYVPPLFSPLKQKVVQVVPIGSFSDS